MFGVSATFGVQVAYSYRAGLVKPELEPVERRYAGHGELHRRRQSSSPRSRSRSWRPTSPRSCGSVVFFSGYRIARLAGSARARRPSPSRRASRRSRRAPRAGARRRVSASRWRRFSASVSASSGWRRRRPALVVERDHRQVRGARVAALAGDRVLGLDPDADLHRGPPDRVDAGAACQQLADEDGMQEGHPVHRRRHRAVARVLDRGEARGLVAQLHHRAAVNEAAGVGVRDRHPPDEDRGRVRRAAGLHRRRCYCAASTTLTWLPG